MRIRVTNKNHPLYGYEYEVVYKDGSVYKVKMAIGLGSIHKEDCEIIEGGK